VTLTLVNSVSIVATEEVTVVAPRVKVEILVAPLNAIVLIVIVVLGIFTLVRPVQLLNAALPMLVTVLGMVRLVKDVQF
jgi:hypothetical protein